MRLTTPRPARRTYERPKGLMGWRVYPKRQPRIGLWGRFLAWMPRIPTDEVVWEEE
jgi:hypothetical protein